MRNNIVEQFERWLKDLPLEDREEEILQFIEWLNANKDMPGTESQLKMIFQEETRARANAIRKRYGYSELPDESDELDWLDGSDDLNGLNSLNRSDELPAIEDYPKETELPDTSPAPPPIEEPSSDNDSQSPKNSEPSSTSSSKPSSPWNKVLVAVTVVAIAIAAVEAVLLHQPTRTEREENSPTPPSQEAAASPTAVPTSNQTVVPSVSSPSSPSSPTVSQTSLLNDSQLAALKNAAMKKVSLDLTEATVIIQSGDTVNVTGNIPAEKVQSAIEDGDEWKLTAGSGTVTVTLPSASESGNAWDIDLDVTSCSVTMAEISAKQLQIEADRCSVTGTGISADTLDLSGKASDLTVTAKNITGQLEAGEDDAAVELESEDGTLTLTMPEPAQYGYKVECTDGGTVQLGEKTLQNGDVQPSKDFQYDCTSDKAGKIIIAFSEDSVSP